MQEEQAYKQCLLITKKEARNFYFGIRLLPSEKRNALSALYALARVLDDIADGDTEAVTDEAKLSKLEEFSLQIKALEAGKTDGFLDIAPLWGVYYGAKKFPIPLSALEDLIAGCKQDALGETKYETYKDTIEYCRFVAGSIGRLSLGVFGVSKTKQIAKDQINKLADDLGVALQLTNILRDVMEDQAMGRRYLPKEDLERFNLSEDLSGSLEAKKDLIAFEADRAIEWYQKGFELLNYLDRQSFACTAAMSGIYYNLAKKIRKNPEVVFEKRISLSKLQKISVVALSLCKIKPR